MSIETLRLLLVGELAELASAQDGIREARVLFAVPAAAVRRWARA